MWRNGERQMEVHGAPVGRGPEGHGETGEQLMANVKGKRPLTKHEVRDGSGEGLQQVESILFHSIPMFNVSHVGLQHSMQATKESLHQLCSCCCISCSN